jgi:hypothetical protein
MSFRVTRPSSSRRRPLRKVYCTESPITQLVGCCRPRGMATPWQSADPAVAGLAQWLVSGNLGLDLVGPGVILPTFGGHTGKSNTSSRRVFDATQAVHEV